MSTRDETDLTAGRNRTTEPPLAPMGPTGAGLGVPAIVFMVLAGAAPLGAVAAMYPVLIAVSQSVVTPLMFVIAGAVLLVFSVGFTRMTKYVHDAGAFYSYVQAGLGRIPGIGAATLAIGAYLLLFIGVAAQLGYATVMLILHFGGPATPWWSWAIAWVGVSGLLAYRNIELSVKVLGVLLSIEILIVVVLDVAIFAHGGAAGFSSAPVNPVALHGGGVALGIMFAFFGYVGFEATAVFRNEARDPDRTIPRATYVAVTLIAVLYGVSAYAITMGVGVDRVVELATANSQSLVLDLAATYVAPVMSDVMQVLITTSILACVVMFHNVLARYLQTISAKGVAPVWWSAIHPRYRAPSRASLAITVPSLIVMTSFVTMGLDPITQIYTWLSGAATLGILALMALTSLAVFVFFRRIDTSHLSPWATSFAPAAAFLCLAAVVCLVVANFALLTGGRTASIVLLIVIVAAYATGVLRALIIRRRHPHTYAALTNTIDTTP